MPKLIQNYKFCPILMCRTLFHTSKHMIVPSLACGENHIGPENQGSQIPHLIVSDGRTLAGEPRSHTDFCRSIRPEIFAKWNRKPIVDTNKKLSVIY